MTTARLSVWVTYDGAAEFDEPGGVGQIIDYLNLHSDVLEVSFEDSYDD